MTDNLQSIRAHLIDELTPDRHQRGKYICPLCGSGDHGAGSDGAFSIDRDGVHGKCFSCGFYGDIFDLEAARTGAALPEATRAVVARYEFLPSTGSPRAAAPAGAQDNAQDTKAAPPPVTADFSAKLRLCAERLPGSEGETYLAGRGFTKETMRRFRLGYDPAYPFLGGSHKVITIPYSKAGSFYEIRSLRDDLQRTHDVPKDTAREIFNVEALYSGRPCFVVESAFCAISIMQVGGFAIALGGIAQIRSFLDIVKKNKPSAPLILSLDNDERGQTAQTKLEEELTSAGIGFLSFCASGSYKDPNELLQNQPDALRVAVSTAYEAAEVYAENLREQEKAAYEETSTAGTFDGFLEYLRRNADRNPVPTGFSSLDQILNGGLVPGLYIMGAVSSLGKTALMVNFADNIAAAGTDVLYFSLEMSKYELMARSISRISFSLAGKHNTNTEAALSTFGVLFGAKQLNNPDSFLKDAIQIYRETIGPHIWYFEGVGSIGVDKIKEDVEKHIAKTGRKPVVFVDYLQIIAPPDARATDKHNTDVIVTSLKQLSRDEDVPVFCISSLNRMNYNEPVNMAAFKESGAIEYGSDVLIGLQLYGIGYKPEEKEQARKARIQEIVSKAEKDDQISIQVRVLKNRNGKRGDSGELKFTKRFNTFYDVPADFTEVYVNDNPFFTKEDEEDNSPLRF